MTNVEYLEAEFTATGSQKAPYDLYMAYLKACTSKDPMIIVCTSADLFHNQIDSVNEYIIKE